MEKYTIKKHRHDADPELIGLFHGNMMRFQAKFDRSAMYDLGNENQADWNKLQGFSDCTDHHHKNSARIAWRWFDGNLELGAYTYCNEERTMQFLTVADINEWIMCSIAKKGDKYHISVDGVCFDAPRENCPDDISYYLGFYFGGDSVAPHTIKVRIINL